MKIELNQQEAAYLQPLLWIIYVGLKDEPESDSPKEKIEERKEIKELAQSILNKIQSQSLEIALSPEGAIPATEEELEITDSIWIKHKETGKISFSHKKLIAVVKQYCYILNPHTRCWEDRGEE